MCIYIILYVCNQSVYVLYIYIYIFVHDIKFNIAVGSFEIHQYCTVTVVQSSSPAVLEMWTLLYEISRFFHIYTILLHSWHSGIPELYCIDNNKLIGRENKKAEIEIFCTV